MCLLKGMGLIKNNEGSLRMTKARSLQAKFLVIDQACLRGIKHE